MTVTTPQSCLLTIATTLLVGACSSQPDCERLQDIVDQREHCQELQQQIAEAQQNLQWQGALQDQYRKQCIETRYYRDSFDKQSVCVNPKAPEEAKKPAPTP